MKQSLFVFSLLLFANNLILFAQNEIPNAGFEVWVTDTQPERWSTGNNIGGIEADAITRTTMTFEGQYAARGEIVESPIVPGFPWLPSLWLGMIANPPAPISQNYTYLRGKYILQQATAFNAVLSIQVNFLDLNMEVTASGHAVYTDESAGFTDFEVLMDYENTPSEEDAAYLQIIIGLAPDDNDPAYGIGSYFIIDDLELTGITSVELTDGNIPDNYTLEQNYPNPFNPTTNIKFSIPEESFVNLKVYNIQGELVATLADEQFSVGTYTADWDAENFPSGVYVYTLRTNDVVLSRKMLLMK